jgi:hypothetical protein
LVAVPFVVLGFILSWLIDEIPLRTTAFAPLISPTVKNRKVAMRAAM